MSRSECGLEDRDGCWNASLTSYVTLQQVTDPDIQEITQLQIESRMWLTQRGAPECTVRLKGPERL